MQSCGILSTRQSRLQVTEVEITLPESSKDLALFAIHICVPTILVPYVIYSAITLTIVPNSLNFGLPWLLFASYLR